MKVLTAEIGMPHGARHRLTRGMPRGAPRGTTWKNRAPYGSKFHGTRHGIRMFHSSPRGTPWGFRDYSMRRHDAMVNIDSTETPRLLLASVWDVPW